MSEMSVTIGGGSQQPEQSAARTHTQPAANASDLDLWLEKIEAMGELKRITAEVDPDLEAATITYLVALEKSHCASARRTLRPPRSRARRTIGVTYGRSRRRWRRDSSERTKNWLAPVTTPISISAIEPSDARSGDASRRA